MIISQLHENPWQKIGSDQQVNVLVVYYFSQYIEVVISTPKSIFTRLRILEILVSDNGTQFSSHEMKEVSKSHDSQIIKISTKQWISFLQSYSQAMEQYLSIRTFEGVLFSFSWKI